MEFHCCAQTRSNRSQGSDAEELAPHDSTEEGGNQKAEGDPEKTIQGTTTHELPEYGARVGTQRQAQADLPPSRGHRMGHEAVICQKCPGAWANDEYRWWRMSVIKWLLKSDPSIRWQVMHDLPYREAMHHLPAAGVL